MGTHQGVGWRRPRRTAWLLLILWTGCALPASAVCIAAPPSPPTVQERKPPPAPEPAPEQKPPAPPPESPPPPARSPVEAQVVNTVPPREPGPQEGELFFEWKYAVNDTDLKGNVERSFLHEGINHILDFNQFIKHPLAEGRMLETAGSFRYTDDPRVDPERNSLQRAYARLTGPSFEFVGGDNLVNFSRFSFNQNVKGLYARKDLDLLDGLRVSGVAGVFTDRWGSIYRGFEKLADFRSVPDPRNPTKPYTRLVLGFRLEKPIEENKTVGVNFSQGSDIIRTLPRVAHIPPPPSPVDNQVVSVDWNLLFRRNLRATGEVALSATAFDPRFLGGKRADYAVRLELSQQWQRYRWRLEYNRFMPNFLSVNARQVQDLQDASAQGTLDITKHLSVTGAFRRTNDNLPGNPVLALLPRGACNDPAERVRLQALSGPSRTLPVCDPVSGAFVALRTFDHLVDSDGNRITTVVRAPEVHLNLRSLPLWPRFLLEVGYRERDIETSNKNSFSVSTQTSSVTGERVTLLAPLFRERATKIPYAEINFPLGISRFRFGYEYRRTRDRVQPENSTFTHRVTGVYRLPALFIGAWTLTSELRYETERESKQVEVETLEDPVSQLPLVDPLTLRPLARRQSGGDQTRTIQGSLTLEFPKYFTLDMLYRQLGAELLSSFEAGAQRQFGNGGYRRPHWRAQLQYRIRNDEDRFFLFTVERNVNTFSLLDPSQSDTRSFREKLAQITFVYRFHR